MARRALPSIPTGSMADIAFLLLVFWLMTTTLESDSGILRQLPPIEENPDDVIVKKRNVYEVLVNFRNELLVEGDFAQITDLKGGAMEFLTNTGVFTEKPGDEDLTSRTWVRRADVQATINGIEQKIQEAADEDNEKAYKKQLASWQAKMDAIEFFGEYRELVPAAVISLQNDKGTSYNTYIIVQNELAAALRQLRDDLCQKHWQMNYGDFDPENNDDHKRKVLAVRKVFPNKISEAEPKDSRN
ncbi:MAG: biopolymer transporter ExbD [Bacteroidota bacterium]